MSESKKDREARHKKFKEDAEARNKENARLRGVSGAGLVPVGSFAPSGLGDPIYNIAKIRSGLTTPEFMSRLPEPGGGVDTLRISAYWRDVVAQRDDLAKLEQVIREDPDFSAAGIEKKNRSRASQHSNGAQTPAIRNGR
ncbi:hypothetical protein N9F34_03880 [Alphaproteobacteria bacterium]|nr:hypothetical protein [Alphaproteobacteria bacterium]